MREALSFKWLIQVCEATLRTFNVKSVDRWIDQHTKNRSAECKEDGGVSRCTAGR